MSGQGVLDFSQFDTEPPDLHLAVFPAEVFDVAAREEAAQVPGPVDARPWGEGVGEKGLCRQLRPVPVAAGDADAPHVDLAGDADRDRLPVAVEHEHLRTGNGAPDAHALGPGSPSRRRTLVDRTPDRGLRRPVFVVQPAPGRLLRVPPCQGLRAALASDDHGPERQQLPVGRPVQNEPVQGGDAERVGDAESLDILHHRRDVGGRRLGQDQGSALRQRPEDPGHGTIEGEGREQQKAAHGFREYRSRASVDPRRFRCVATTPLGRPIEPEV